jgi:carbamoyltransferase
MTYILGLSAYYHDSAAVLLDDGKIVAAAQEERFTRKKHDAAFPCGAIAYCLEAAGIGLEQVDDVVFYDKPLVKFERLLETYLSYAPSGFRSFLAAMPIWLKEKLYIKRTLKTELLRLSGLKQNELPNLLFSEHHQSHAASAFFSSPYQSAAVLCLDGVGEWATTSVWQGKGNKLEALWEIDFPHSLGLLYSAFTYYAGFKVNSGEYKLMGLAPYGVPKYVDLILDNLIDLKDDGSFRLDMQYFNYAAGLTMTNARFARLFGAPARKPEGELTQREMDIARSIQDVTEMVVLRLANTIHKSTGAEYLCLAGGVALNCVANGKLLREGPFKDIWVQPAAGDAGGALGAAQVVWYGQYDGQREADNEHDSMSGAYLGPQFSDQQIEAQLSTYDAHFVKLDDESLFVKLSEKMADGQVVGWFQGRMEFGPRALGGRSIIGDPRNRDMQSMLNLKIKFRESFRPFAPSILAEDVSDYFHLDRPSPYMLIVADVKEQHRIELEASQSELFGVEKLKVVRSSLPAVTHVDYSARIQTIHKQTNPRYYALIEEFKRQTGCPVIVNTSFNVRGEPIVGTPEDAYRCFMRTNMDCLVIENYLLVKADQPEWPDDQEWMDEFELD